MRLIGILFGIKETVLWDSSIALDLKCGPHLTYEHFQMLLYAILNSGDDGFRVGSMGAEGLRGVSSSSASNKATSMLKGGSFFCSIQ